MAKKPSNQNAMKALEEMKLEIANELGSDLTMAGKVGRTMARNLVRMGEVQLADEDKDTFYPI